MLTAATFHGGTALPDHILAPIGVHLGVLLCFLSSAAFDWCSDSFEMKVATVRWVNNIKTYRNI